jgi:hypothetical protein
MSAASHFNMAAINKGRQRNRVFYDILNNLSSVDLFYDKKQQKLKEPAASCTNKTTQMDLSLRLLVFSSPYAGTAKMFFSRCWVAFYFYHRRFIWI